MPVVFSTIFGNRGEGSISTVCTIIFLGLGKVDASTTGAGPVASLYMLSVVVGANPHSESATYTGCSRHPSLIADPDYYISTEISGCPSPNKNPSSSSS